MTPFFSIITCTKNSAKYLRENIISIKAQTCKDYEHIFVDGLSKDATPQIIEEYRATDPSRVSLIQAKPNGIGDAMNRGTEKAQGTYVIHLHSDDILHDNMVLADVMDFLKKNGEPDWIYSKEMSVGAEGREIKITNNRKVFQGGSRQWWSSYVLKYHDYIRHQSVYMRKDVFTRFDMFDNSFPIAMDYELWLRLRNKTRWLFYDRITDHFRMHDEGISSTPANRVLMQTDEMRAGRRYMNGFEFYIVRPAAKILAKVASEIMLQISLYRSFKERVGNRL